MPQSERKQHEKETREHAKGLVNSPDEFHAEAEGFDGQSVGVHAVGGFVWVGVSDGKEVKFDADGLYTLVGLLDAARMAVS